MNKSVDETDRSDDPGVVISNIITSTTNTTINSTAITDHLNNKLNNNNNNNNVTTIDHPLNLINNNKNNNNQIIGDDSFSDDMTEINLKSSIDLNGDNNLKKDTRKKINWVKFDDDDDDDDDIDVNISSGNNIDNNTTILTENSNINNNINNNNISNLNTNIISNKLPPPPANKIIINSPVSSTTSHQVNKTLPSTSSDVGAAVLATESVHINLNNSSITPQKPNSTTTNPNNNNTVTTTTTTSTNSSNNGPKSVSISISTPAPPMRTIELSTGRIREGFANGDVIVTLLPTNTKLPWITPAVFRPELVPEELMAQGLTLTVEEYVNAMETLVNDYRFTAYNICYKRVLMCWIIFAFCVLLTLLFSGMQGIALFSLGVAWLFLNAAAIFLCMWVKLRLSRGLEKCLARVNKQLLRHKILLILDDRGRISCHKVNLCFMYFDPALCIAYLNEFIERHEQNGTSIQAGWEKKLDLDVNDIVIQGSNPVRLSRKQEKSMLIYLRYASRWGNEIVRGLGDVSITEPARHCANYICPCQYIERHLACKPRGKFKMFNINYWVLASEHYEN